MCYTRLVTETEKMCHCGFSLDSGLPSTAVRVHCPLTWPLPGTPVGVGDGGLGVLGHLHRAHGIWSFNQGLSHKCHVLIGQWNAAQGGSEILLRIC